MTADRPDVLKACVLALGVAATVGLSGCGKSEDASYTAKPQDDAVRAALASPLPAAPAWTGEVLGRPVATLVKGSATCKGAVDVTLKHAAAGHAGNEVQGWAWDVHGKAPLARILLTDAASRVIGAGVVDRSRPDVSRALPEVKTPRVGWTAVTRATTGVSSVMGLTQAGAMCALGSAQLS